MKLRLIGRFSVAMMAAVTLLPGSLSAQQSLREQLLGAWNLVSVIGERPDGSKVEVFGVNPKGIIIFTGDGLFSLFQSSAEVPKIAANDRAKATPEEATGVLRASIAYYGTYSVNEVEKILSVRVDGSTFANLVGGPEQRRIITSITSEELRFTNPRTPAGIALQTVWKRAKVR
jgi:lipocalin-like protein